MLALLLGVSLWMPAAVPVCERPPENVPGSQLAVVSGQITDVTGAPVPHAWVQLKAASGERTYNRADENGCYRLTSPAGEYTLLARYPGFRTASIRVHPSSEHAVVENVHLEIGSYSGVWVEGTGKFAAYVVDATGTPIGEVDVVLTPVGAIRSGSPIRFHADAWGFWEVQPQQGTYELTVSALGFQPLHRTVQIGDKDEPAQTLTLVRTTP